MGLLSNQISRETLKPGDHIYSWRNAYIYSHHGIYVGDEKVIHFTRGGGLETGTGTFLDMFIASSVPNHGGDNNPCPKCGDQSKLDGVISSCLDCFLAGGNLYLFEYGVSPAFFVAKQRGGTCTIAPSDPPEEVIFRAKFLLLRNAFGAYNLFENNCEDFAIYCKSGLVVIANIKLGSSGQANSASIARDAVSSTLGLLGVVNASGRAASVVSSTLRYVVPNFGAAFGGLVLVGGYGKYCMDCLYSDIGMRSDVTKVPVQGLVSIIELMEGRSEDNKSILDQIEGRDLPPTITHVHEKLINHEAKLLSPTMHSALPVTVNVATQRNNNNSNRHHNNNNNNNRNRYNNNSNSSSNWQPSYNKTEQRGPRPYLGRCQICNVHGHSARRCPQLQGRVTHVHEKLINHEAKLLSPTMHSALPVTANVATQRNNNNSNRHHNNNNNNNNSNNRNHYNNNGNSSSNRRTTRSLVS
ncbi:LRAT-like domain [Arabidopsis thaliana x Arabidopsis arenosa]|uniref:LRAT-like domain n=1 Tax=Arabidopsis thaliana x Arabidopsis arenosa TaxID=1240361 RepID=A0A8T1YWE4_9BRAS|nr:LRAT-like domain [Arabidopsis thaliana x Arabidopsis arenosa]